MLFSLFHTAPDGFEPIVKGELLLSNSPARLELVKRIRKLAGVTDKVWEGLYWPIIVSTAELMQEIPASEYQHHSYPGGLLDHTLESLRIALNTRSNIENPFGIDQDNMVMFREVFTYAVFVCACCHDIGKVLVDHDVRVCDKKGKQSNLLLFGKALPEQGAYYKTTFSPSRTHGFHESCGLMVLYEYVPQDGLNWLGSNKNVLAWVIGSFVDQNNPISEIVKEADRTSVRRNLGLADQQSKSVQGRAPFLIPMYVREMLDGGRIKLNMPGAMGFIKNGYAYVVTKRFLELLRTRFDEDKAKGLPNSSSRVLDLMTEYRLIESVNDRAIIKVLFSSEEWANKTYMPCIKLVLSEFYKPGEELPGEWIGSIDEMETDGKVEPVVQPTSEPPSTDNVDSHNDEKEISKKKDSSDAVSEPVVQHDKKGDELTAEEDSEIMIPQSENVPDKKTEPVVQNMPVEKSSDDTDGKLVDDFILWIKDGIVDGSLKINTRDSLIHITPEGLGLVVPATFRLFDEVVCIGYENIQNIVSNSNIYRSNNQNGYMFSYQISGKRKQSILHCWVLNKATTTHILKEANIKKKNNPHLKLITSQRKEQNEKG